MWLRGCCWWGGGAGAAGAAGPVWLPAGNGTLISPSAEPHREGDVREMRDRQTDRQR